MKVKTQLNLLARL